MLHPIPDRHIGRVKRSADGMGVHVVYKREMPKTEFCGVDEYISEEDLLIKESAVNEDVFVMGNRMEQSGQLVVGDFLRFEEFF